MEMIDKAPKLKYIGMFGTGYGRIDTEYAAGKGITVTNIAGYSTESVAELAIAVLLEHIRELGRGKKQALEGNYSEDAFFGVYEIKGKNFGIIGIGRIGSRLAEIVQGFGAKVSYWNRTKKPGLEYKELDELVASADFISIHLPYVPETKHLLNSGRIGKIKPGAVVVNLSPMELIDIDALCGRLEKGDITFILDHSDELEGEELAKLRKFENCIIYPPFGYTTREATRNKQEMFVDNIADFLKGKPTNKVN